ncbi:MAG: hypothetical protein LUD50_00075 [Clostridia bacterium]|nr:hypothetical protein [Clostridia bacterium]
MKLSDILSKEYPEFLAFCQDRNVRKTEQLTEDVYSAYRLSTGRLTEFTDGIKAKIAEAEAEPDRMMWETLGVEPLEEYRSVPVTALGYSARTLHFCQREGIKTLYDVLCRRNREFRNKRNAGAKTLHELYDFTRDYMANGAVHAAQGAPEETGAVQPRDKDSALDRMMWETLEVPLEDKYRLIPVRAIGYSARTLHFCQREGIKSLYDLLSRRNREFRNRVNVGTKTLHELYDCTKAYIASGAADAYEGPYVKAPDAPQQESPLDPEPVWLPLDMEDEEGQKLEKKLENLISSSPQQASMLCLALRAYYRPVFAYYRSLRDTMQACKDLPEDIKRSPAGPYLRIYVLRFPEEAKTLAVWPEELTLPEMLHRAAHEDPEDMAAEAAASFCAWLQSLDIKAACGEIFSEKTLDGPGVWDKARDKYWGMTVRRAGGETLDGIGQDYGITRERVRQIETVSLRLFREAYLKNPYDLAGLMFLKAGGTILTHEQAKGFLGEPAGSLFWLLAKRHKLDCGAYEYNDTVKAVCLNSVTGTPGDSKKILEAMKSLPDAFYEDEMPDLFAKASADSCVPVEVLEEWLPYCRKKYGPLYSTAKPDMAQMCEYLLRYCFQDGYKVGDPDMADKALRRIAEAFGKRSDTTPRYLNNRIFIYGQQVDRGLYMYPGYVHMDYSVLDDVCAYIDASESSIISFSELYVVFKDSLEAAGIANRYALQGAMKRCGCRYTTTRDYILKDEAGSMAAELSAYAKARGRFTIKDFAEAYPYYKANLVYQLAPRTDDVIQLGGGTFMDASLLVYSHKEEMDIMSFIYLHMTPSGMDTDAVFAEFRMTFAPFCVHNGIESASGLFYILEHMYPDYFTFARPMVIAD